MSSIDAGDSSAVVPRTEEEVEGKQENEQSNVHPLIEQFRNLNPVISTQMEGRLLQIYEACLEYSTLEEVAEEINVGIGKKGMSVSELVLNMELFLNGL